MTTAPCPLCHSEVIIDDSEAYEHDLVTCANCGRDLEIVSIAPIGLAALSDDSDPA